MDRIRRNWQFEKEFIRMAQKGCCVRILGIDPGSRVTGYGIIDVDLNIHQGRDVIQSYGVIELDPNQ
jgi:hypothetical protein